MNPKSGLDLYLEYLKYEKNLAENSISSYKKDICQLNSFMEEHNILNICDFNLVIFRKFLKSLDCKKYSNRTIIRKYSAYINYFRFLEENKIIKSNISQFIIVPRKKIKYYTVLSRDEMKKLFSSMKTASSIDIRDRTIIELLYSTGARVSEIENMKIEDLNLKNNEIKVMGKGRKERIVYINNIALYWLDKYIKGARNELSYNNKSRSYSRDGHLFLNSRGSGLTSRSIREIVKKNVRIAGIKKNITPHSLRHSFATHLLQEGAGIREIQELLGHASISTTEIYSHMDIEKIKSDYRKFHPRAG
jgi:integrase/recombinase XerD